MRNTPYTLQKFLECIENNSCPSGLTLNLEWNHIGTEGAKAIAAALQSEHCPNGLTLILNENEIGTDGVKAIATALESGHCPTGLALELRWNNIRTDGARAIAEALGSGRCPSGLTLHLAHNSIGDEGAKAIAAALGSGRCPSGLSLNLDHNNIGTDEGVKAIAAALGSGRCPDGLTVDLRGNNIRTEGEYAMSCALFELASQGKPVPTARGVSEKLSALNTIASGISNLYCEESGAEVDIDALLKSIDTCFNAYADTIHPSIATYILDFLSRCILQKTAEENQHNVIALLKFWNTKLNTSALKNASLTKLYQEKFADVLFKIEPCLGNTIDTKINFADILAKQAALLYHASKLHEEYKQPYTLKLESLLLALSGKKCTEKNRNGLPKELSHHPHYLAAFKKIHTHLIQLELAMKITPPERTFCYKGFKIFALKSKPGLPTDITPLRKFISFFKECDRARDDNSMKPYTPQIRSHEI